MKRKNRNVVVDRTTVRSFPYVVTAASLEKCKCIFIPTVETTREASPLHLLALFIVN